MPLKKKTGQTAPAISPVRGEGRLPALSPEAKHLLVEAAQDERGLLVRVRTHRGLTIQTNGQNLVEGQSHQEWDGALQMLKELALLQERGSQGEVFSPTEEGYRVAELLREKRFLPIFGPSLITSPAKS